jgi:hypothetical protein
MRRRFGPHATYANLASSVALFIALGGAAYAEVGNPFVGRGGVIHGCVGTKRGVLTLLRSGKKCPRGTTSLRFNQTGRTGSVGLRGSQGLQGVVGQQGIQGRQGIQGPIGPSGGYFNSSTSSEAVVSVPPGDYMVYGLTGFTAGGTADTGFCPLQISNGMGTISATNNSVTVPISSSVVLSNQGVAHLTSPAQLVTGCFFSQGGTTAHAAITAIKVDTASP